MQCVLKNTRYISILRRYFLCGGTLFAFGRKMRHKANVWRICGVKKKPPIPERPVVKLRWFTAPHRVAFLFPIPAILHTPHTSHYPIPQPCQSPFTSLFPSCGLLFERLLKTGATLVAN